MASDIKTNNVGVPQGSVLGPQLFNLFINDMSNIPNVKLLLFADDAVFYVTDPLFSNCIDKLNTCIDHISKWLVNNKLTPNLNKTKIMLFSPKPIGVLPNIYFNDTIISWVDSYEYLGIIIDDKINFILQSKVIQRKLNSLLGVIYSMHHLMPSSTLKLLYNTLVYPVLINNIIIWGNCKMTQKTYRD